MKEKLNRTLRSQSKTSETSFRTSRISIPSRMPDSKWRDIFEEEYNSSVVNSILKEIISLTMDAIYNVYFEKTVYFFVVHCSHLAWLQLFDAMDLQYDFGENSESIRKTWAGDEELKPPPIDSLCCKNVDIRKQSKDCCCKNSVN